MIVQERDGNIVTEDELIKKRWREYFDQLLNTENRKGILEKCDKFEGPEVVIERVKVKKALKRMKAGKAGDRTEVTSDMLLALGDDGIDWLTVLLNKVWKQDETPDDWKHCVLIPIFKGKGSILNCGEYRGVKLLEHGMKVYERIIDSRLGKQQVAVDEIQFGFMPGKGTTDATFILGQAQEKSLEGNEELYIAFVDLEKAYDGVPREEIYWCLRKRGVSEKIVREMKVLLPGQQDNSAMWSRSNRIVLSRSRPTSRLCTESISICSCGGHYQRGCKEATAKDLLYADDLGIVAGSEEELQERVYNGRKT